MSRRFPLARLLLLNAAVLVAATVAVPSLPSRPAPSRSPQRVDPVERDVREILASRDPELALDRLRRRGEPGAAAVLERLGDAPDAFLRGRALLELATLDPERAAPGIARRLGEILEPNERVLTLEAALVAPAPGQRDALEHHARSDDPLERSLALGALVALGRAGAEDALRSLADGSDPWEDLAVAAVLARAGSPLGKPLRERALLALPASERPEAERLVTPH